MAVTVSEPLHTASDSSEGTNRRRIRHLTLIALGVVYGDIGTSPLYSLRECFNPAYGLAPSPANVYGVLSLIVWSLILVVSVKYLAFIVRADNHGEGGVLALLALILQQERRASDKNRRNVIIALGLFGAALLYGDGVITPAISVLGAMEGLEVITPHLKSAVVPLTLVTLFALFLVQKNGTHSVGRIFGPVMGLWFATIAILGIRELTLAPEILGSLNPLHAFNFFVAHGTKGFILLGAVVLVVTGGEALYADMGHFGARPIRLAWFCFVLPALLLNYFGQGALILRDPSAVANPFFLLAPRLLLYPLVALATCAAIIASQALISGAFSLTHQAVQLGYCPRVHVVYTSKTEHGQISVPEVNKALMIGCLLVVLGFRSVSAVGAAYGIAVTGTMAITTILFYVLARSRWKWSVLRAASLAGFFLTTDPAFLAANALKFLHGGWVPIVIGGAIFTLMTTWNSGRRIVQSLLARGSLPIDLFLVDVLKRKPYRAPGTAVFMTSNPEGAPLVLLHHLRHNKTLLEHVVLLSILSANVPEVSREARISVTPLGQGFWRVVARYGFMETANVPAILAECRELGVTADRRDTTFFLGRERLLPTGRASLAKWRKKLYIFMSRNSRTATEYFSIPPNRVVELGAQLEM
jgi:KUP system potassium uptake protein